MANQIRKSWLWQNSYTLVMLVITIFGSVLIWIGTAWPNEHWPADILIGFGIAFVPAGIIGFAFRVFLVIELQQYVIDPLLKKLAVNIESEFREDTKRILDNIDDAITNYKREMGYLAELHVSGIVTPYDKRDEAIKAILEDITEEITEIFIIGSSLMGIQSNDPTWKQLIQILKAKKEEGVSIKILLTHPIVADFRARQESRGWGDIGREIIASLRKINEEGMGDNTKLYVGTPTCFGIKTTKRMMLNAYPHGKVAFNSPCLIVQNMRGRNGYIYDSYHSNHFQWESPLAVSIGKNKNEVRAFVDQLENNLDKYSNRVRSIIEEVISKGIQGTLDCTDEVD